MDESHAAAMPAATSSDQHRQPSSGPLDTPTTSAGTDSPRRQASTSTPSALSSHHRATSSIVFPPSPRAQQLPRSDAFPARTSSVASGVKKSNSAAPERPPRSRSRTNSIANIIPKINPTLASSTLPAAPTPSPSAIAASSSSSSRSNTPQLQREADSMVNSLPPSFSHTLQPNHALPQQPPQSGLASPTIVTHSPMLDTHPPHPGSEETESERTPAATIASTTASTRTSMISSRTSDSSCSRCIANTHDSHSPVLRGISTKQHHNQHQHQPPPQFLKSMTPVLSQDLVSPAADAVDGKDAQKNAHELHSQLILAMQRHRRTESEPVYAALLDHNPQLASSLSKDARIAFNLPQPALAPSTERTGSGLDLPMLKEEVLARHSGAPAGPATITMPSPASTAEASFTAALSFSSSEQGSQSNDGRSQAFSNGEEGDAGAAGSQPNSAFVSAAGSPAMSPLPRADHNIMPLLLGRLDDEEEKVEVLQPQLSAALEASLRRQQEADAAEAMAHASADLLQAQLNALPASRRSSLGGLRRWLSSTELAAEEMPSTQKTMTAPLFSTAVAAGRAGLHPAPRPATSSGPTSSAASASASVNHSGAAFEPQWYRGTTLLSNPRYRPDILAARNRANMDINNNSGRRQQGPGRPSLTAGEMGRSVSYNTAFTHASGDTPGIVEEQDGGESYEHLVDAGKTTQLRRAATVVGRKQALTAAAAPHHPLLRSSSASTRDGADWMRDSGAGSSADASAGHVTPASVLLGGDHHPGALALALMSGGAPKPTPTPTPTPAPVHGALVPASPLGARPRGRRTISNERVAAASNGSARGARPLSARSSSAASWNSRAAAPAGTGPSSPRGGGTLLEGGGAVALPLPDVPVRSSSRLSLSVESYVESVEAEAKEEPQLQSGQERVDGEGVFEVDQSGDAGADADEDSDPTRFLLYGRNDGNIPALLATRLPTLAPQLRILDISGCALTEIPECVTQCTTLTELNVSANPLQLLPAFLGQLTTLHTLVADSCELVCLPYALRGLADSLAVLSVRGNRLTHVPSWLHYLHALERLNVEDNPLRGQWVSILDPLMRASALDAGRMTSRAAGASMPQTEGLPLGAQSPVVSFAISGLPTDSSVSMSSIFSNGGGGARTMDSASTSPIALASTGRGSNDRFSGTFELPPVSSKRLSSGGLAEWKMLVRPRSGSTSRPGVVERPMSPSSAPERSGLGAPFQQQQSRPTLSNSGPSTGPEGTPRVLDGEDEEEEAEEVLSIADDEPQHTSGLALSFSRAASPLPPGMLSGRETPMSMFESEAGGDRPRVHSSAGGSFLSVDPADAKAGGSRWKIFRKNRKGSSSMGGGMKDFLPGSGNATAPDGSPSEQVGSIRATMGRWPSSRPNSSAGVVSGSMTIPSSLSSTTVASLPPASPATIAFSDVEPGTPVSIVSATSSSFLGGVRRFRKGSHSHFIGHQTPDADGSDARSQQQQQQVTPTASSVMTRTPLTATNAQTPAVPEARARFSPMSPFQSLASEFKGTISRARGYVGAKDGDDGQGDEVLVDEEDEDGVLVDGGALHMDMDRPIPMSRGFSNTGASLNGADAPSRPATMWPEHYARLRALLHYLQDLDELGPDRPDAPTDADEQQQQVRSGTNTASKRSSYVGGGTSTPRSGTDSDAASHLSPVVPATASFSALGSSRPPSNTPSIHSDTELKLAEAPVYKDSASLRSRIISEIISTEMTYVTLLAELVEIYVRPARRPWDGSSQPPVPAGEQRAVFSNVDTLLSFHQGAFLPALLAAAKPLTLGHEDEVEPDAELTAHVAEQIANVFSTHAAFLRSYVPYVNGAEEAQLRIMAWRTGSHASAHPARPHSPFFKPRSILPDSSSSSGADMTSSQRKRARAFLKKCREHPKHSQLSLESYLLLPVQRIPRYRLLLEQLRKATPPERLHDPMATTRALDHVSTMASSVNESKRQAEQDRRLLQWQNRIRGKWPSPLVQPHRRFIQEGELVLRRVVKREMSFDLLEGAAEWMGVWPEGEMVQDHAITMKGDHVMVDYLHQQALFRSVTVLLCNDLIALVTPIEIDRVHGPDGRDIVDLFGVLHLQTSRPVQVLAGNNLRVVDKRSILYFSCKTLQEAQSWATAMNATRLAMKQR